jgi:hypothetical protein
MKKIIFTLLAAVLSFNAFALEVKSPVLANKGYIPDNYTCDGRNISPEISWSDAPKKTVSLALICDDPDAPFATWTHWVVYDIPPNVSKLDEGLPKDGVLKSGILQGVNDFGEIGFGGPCPPAGKAHRYFFRLYALDTMLKLEKGAARKDLERLMVGHILAEAGIYGLYQRK